MPQSAIALNYSATVARRSGPIKVITDASRIFALTDVGKWLDFTSGSAQTATLPADNVVNFPISTVLTFSQAGAGALTVAAGAGATVQSAGNKLAAAAQFAVIQAVKVAANTWRLYGNLA